MKKILVLAMVLVSSIVAFAENNNVENFDAKKYELNVNVNSLARCLQLDNEQKDYMTITCKELGDNFKMLPSYENAEKRNHMTNVIIKHDLNKVKYFLTREQYKKYLMIVNATMINRKITVE